MRRREFITVVGGATAWPLAVIAQQMIQKRRIGVLMAYEELIAEAQAWVAAFREGFRKLGWTEGGDFQIDVRWATGDKATIARFAKEMVALQPDLILSSSTPTTAALLEQTRTIPIVLQLSLIQPAQALSRASPGRVATPLGSPISSRRWAVNG